MTFAGFSGILYFMSKPRIGRPPKPAAEKRTVVILSKVTPEEAEAVQAKADAAKLPLSAWVRRTIVKAKR